MPGFCLRYAISSATDFTGRSRLTTTTSGVRNSSATACRSRSVSNDRLFDSFGLAASELAEASSVSPSGGELATRAVATTPPPPGRFSITNGLPSRSCSLGAIARITTSMLPPGGNGTTNVTGPDG